MTRGNLAGIIVGCIIAVIGIIGIATSGEPTTPPELEPTPTYTLSVHISPSGAGWVSPSGGEYEFGDQVTLTASPASGYTFDQWSGDASGTSPTIVITMYSDKNIIANFRAIQTTPGVLFSDDFSDESSGWSQESFENSEFRYEDGEYHILVKDTYWLAWAWTLSAGRFTDFALEVDARQVSESSGSGYGVIFRLQNGDNFYSFELTGDGYYNLNKYLNGEWITLRTLTRSDFINEGNGTNHLKVVCEGSQIQVYVNGHHLATVIDDSFVEGYVGVIAEAFGLDTHVAFDNIVVSEP